MMNGNSIDHFNIPNTNLTPPTYLNKLIPDNIIEMTKELLIKTKYKQLDTMKFIDIPSPILTDYINRIALRFRTKPHTLFVSGFNLSLDPIIESTLAKF